MHTYSATTAKPDVHVIFMKLYNYKHTYSTSIVKLATLVHVNYMHI